MRISILVKAQLIIMEKGSQLADRFRELMLSGKWIANTNLRACLSEVDWKQATSQIASLNTIALLTFHINYYVKGVLDVLKGAELSIRDKYSFDMPVINSQEDWEHLRNTFLQNAADFAEEVEKLEKDALEKDFSDAKYGTVRRNIEGMIEHAYYHFGQISLLKKLLRHGNQN